VGITDNIAKIFQDRLQLPDATVEVRTGYNPGNGPNAPEETSLIVRVQDKSFETNPDAAKPAILNALTIDPLKPYILTEPETKHMERLAGEVEWFRSQEAAFSDWVPTISERTPKWFKELPERDEWSIQHALNVTQGADGIGISIATPKDIDQQIIVNNMQGRKDAIMEALADGVVKYTPTADTPEKQAALKEQVKKLNVTITSSVDGDAKTVGIIIMSAEQSAAATQPGGMRPEQIESLKLTNPLMALQNGVDDKGVETTPEKLQPHLQKALAKAILFAGDKDKADEIFSLIAGKEDMRRTLVDSLQGLKAKAGDNAELAQRIDAFLNDPVFKDPHQWDKKAEYHEFIAKEPAITKVVEQDYKDGLMEVTIPLPHDKFPEILQQLAALDKSPVAIPVETTSEPPVNVPVGIANSNIADILAAGPKPIALPEQPKSFKDHASTVLKSLGIG